MTVKNNTNTQITLIGFFMDGNHLILAPHEESEPFIPNKDMMKVLINKSPDLELKVSSSNELELISELDPRACNIVKFD